MKDVEKKGSHPGTNPKAEESANADREEGSFEPGAAESADPEQEPKAGREKGGGQKKDQG